MTTTTQSLANLAIGTAIEGGFFAGHLRIGDQCFALIRAPKHAEHPGTPWNNHRRAVPAAQSWNDGLANTRAMAAAGSAVAQWALAQQINGLADWYIPATDELEMLYRAFKPTDADNYLYNRSGINVSAVPPTHPYTPTTPAQIAEAIFREDGAEALDPAWYWSSTQHAGYDGCAWCQDFGDGSQGYDLKVNGLRVVLVRRVAI